jgi:hypothetical protein
MVFAATAVERAMKIQGVILRALSGALMGLQAADILGVDPQSWRQWRARFEAGGALGSTTRAGSPRAAGRRPAICSASGGCFGRAIGNSTCGTFTSWRAGRTG